MSKRRNRKKTSAPNLSPETLERARREAGLIPPLPEEPAEEAEQVLEVEEALEEEAVEVIAPPVPRRASRREADALPAARKPARRRKEQAYEEMTQEEVLYALAHPTKTVPEDELRETYSYVIADLRGMLLLAVALFVALVVIAGIVVV